MNKSDPKECRVALTKAALQFMSAVAPYGIEAVFTMVEDHLKSKPSMQGWHRARILDAMQDARDSVSRLLNRLDQLAWKETPAETVEGDQ